MELVRRHPIIFWMLVLVIVGIWIGVVDARAKRVRGDFSRYTLAASKVMFAGGNPYDKYQVSGHNYKYFPTNAIVLWPFTRMNVYVAQGIWFALNVGLLVWMFYCLRAMVRPFNVPWWVWAVTLLFTFRIINMNLKLGQWNTSVLCLSLIGLRYLADRKWWGSLLLGLAITLKFLPAIFLGYFIARRQWRSLGLTLAATVAWIVLVPVIVLGPGRTLELMDLYQADSRDRLGVITGGADISSVSMQSTIFRAMSPVTIELGGTNYVTNYFNLPRENGARVARIAGFVMLAAFGVWIFSQRKIPVNALGELLLISLCYLAWLIAAPGVRHAQIISNTPLMFCLVMSIAISQGQTRKTVVGLLIITGVLYTMPSKIISDTEYNMVAEATGVVAFAMVVQFAAGLYCYYRIGREARRVEDESGRIAVGLKHKLSGKLNGGFQI